MNLPSRPLFALLLQVCIEETLPKNRTFVFG
jgi:hypothetical protein